MPNKQKKEFKDFKSNFYIRSNSRINVRNAVVKHFLNEEYGYWKKDVKIVTRYTYFVETLEDGRKIYLRRPTRNYNFDFQVYIENFKDGKDKRPSHNDILDDLKIKKIENIKQFKKLFKLIKRIWACESPNNVIKDFNFKFKNGFQIDLILKTLKWLFIEQDITYWNGEGRNMLFDKLSEIN